MVHYTVFASGPYDYLLSDRFLAYLDAAGDSYKVAFFQDEHQYCQKRFAFLDRHNFDCVYTCFSPEQFEATYGTYTNVPKLVSHVPAYVHPDMVVTAERLRVPDSERPIDIGYRARPTPPYFGRGGMEKYEIGERFAEAAAGSGLKLDLTAREEDRLYGENWYEFMATCRGFLGTESGVSCSDLEDEVRLEYEALLAAGEEPTIERLEQGALGRWDWKVPLRTTSSRHFEAAALRVCQVMYEGHYSGALRPMEHYIPLRKDFSNFDEALTRFRDPAVRRELTENAYRDLIASGEYGYEGFFAGFDQTLIEAGLSPPAEPASAELVQQATTRRPVKSLADRYLFGTLGWLHRNHPWAWRVVGPLVRLGFYATWPVVALVRALKKARSRDRARANP